MKLALEQPADPSHYVPEVVSFWGTKEWKKLQNMYQLQEQTFRQSSFGGRAVKPTTFGGDLPLCVPQQHEEIQEEEVKPVASSQDLARWAPGLMRQVAESLQQAVMEESALCKDELGGAHTERTYTFQKRLPGLPGSFSEGENAFESQPSTSWDPQPGHLWSFH